jgi:hypothetical protein
MAAWNRGPRVLAVAALGVLAVAATHFYWEWALFTDATIRRLLFGGME